jgi:hypothetical protein
MYCDAIKKYMRVLIFLFFTIGSESILSIEGTIYVNGSLNLRESKNINSKVILKIPNETSVTILANSNKIENINGYESIWYRIKYKDKIGWVFGKYIDFEPNMHYPVDCSVFTIRKDKIRVISARPMSRKERSIYESIKETT